MKRILSGLSCWLAVGFSLCGAENLPLLMQTGKYEQVKSLVEAGGVDLEETDRYNRTVLHWAAIANAELIPTLLAKGADIEARDGSGMTPLHHAVSARNTAAVEKQGWQRHDSAAPCRQRPEYCGGGKTACGES